MWWLIVARDYWLKSFKILRTWTKKYCPKYWLTPLPNFTCRSNICMSGIYVHTRIYNTPCGFLPLTSTTVIPTKQRNVAYRYFRLYFGPVKRLQHIPVMLSCYVSFRWYRPLCVIKLKPPLPLTSDTVWPDVPLRSLPMSPIDVEQGKDLQHTRKTNNRACSTIHVWCVVNSTNILMSRSGRNATSGNAVRMRSAQILRFMNFCFWCNITQW